eukprot:TRINITY_DN57788_c0_g1_i1.p2 TRINITY_DN57788_c0_g1~~TRINITY_DN57788_c0_g1_i1.p2  ORF type:complete len:109 (-),score=19.05 TRINITY_DN57788_c0_g1_i1:336-662(-)
MDTRFGTKFKQDRHSQNAGPHPHKPSVGLQHGVAPCGSHSLSRRRLLGNLGPQRPSSRHAPESDASSAAAADSAADNAAHQVSSSTDRDQGAAAAACFQGFQSAEPGQ